MLLLLLLLFTSIAVISHWLSLYLLISKHYIRPTYMQFKIHIDRVSNIRLLRQTELLIYELDLLLLLVMHCNIFTIFCCWNCEWNRTWLISSFVFLYVLVCSYLITLVNSCIWSFEISWICQKRWKIRTGKMKREIER